ncbi:tetratricopeptide repeat protein [Actinocrinis puniceicyclus]|uniref:Tetratricopeptide repeat protein n=1 Tax=Actinocrinis puniceicyclus TaxID=977794 RepID=A0A8J7WS65_9ACTN|nr:tetratricopeptide repeat protein [Actinocrinis puniceicyclus]MBS2965735.1 tetratricopeptide repeat protein [Actinocrinis puniceicyclus]
MTDRFNSVLPDGEPTADRWAGSLHLFDTSGPASGEEGPVERWERAGLMFAEKRYSDAAAELDTLVREFPDHTGARLLLARACYHSAQLRRAEEHLRAVIERDPVEPYAHLMLGRTLERQGRGADAAPWLRMAGALAGEAE